MSVPRPDTAETFYQTPLPDTLHRDTVRSAVAPIPAAPTVLTPFPGAQPQQQPAAATPPRRGSTALLAVVAVFLVLGLAAIGFVLLRRTSEVETPKAAPRQVAVTTPTPPPPASRTTVDVVPPTISEMTSTNAVATESAATVTSSTAPTTPVTEAPKPAPERARPTVEKPKPVEPPARQEEPPAVKEVRTYVEGGDSDSNELALADLRQQIRGTTRVSLHGNADLLNDLGNRLKDDGELTISDSADVEINFYGTVERLRLGRKRRSANVTVLKNGRPVFKYVLRPEEYRVGDNPAEAFARVLIEALH